MCDTQSMRVRAQGLCACVRARVRACVRAACTDVYARVHAFMCAAHVRMCAWMDIGITI